MKNEITDEQIDQLLKAVMRDSAATDETLADVADSPRVWWAVQREIATRKDAKAMPWPPVSNWIRLLGIAIPAAAAILIAVFFYNNGTIERSERAGTVPKGMVTKDDIDPASAPEASINNGTDAVIPVKAAAPAAKSPRQRSARQFNSMTKVQPDALTNARSIVKANEVKSDFIALSYAGSAESGQIVRVKVPGALKVQLGIAQNVSDPAGMVDAEVLIGDDGITRAIRFIRQSGGPND